MESSAIELGYRDKQHGAFFRDLKRRVASYLDGRDGRVATPGIWTALIGVAAVGIGSYGAALSGLALPGWSLALYGLAGIAPLFLAATGGHDAAHGALSGRSWVNLAVVWTVFALMGLDGRLWRLRHLGSHHVYPNVVDGDIDVDESWFARLSPHHRRRAHHRFQHIYGPLLYTVVLLHAVYIQDFRLLFRRRLANMRNLGPSLSAVFSVLGTKVVHMGVMLALPMALLPQAWETVLAVYVVSQAVMSVLFVLIVAGTHVSDLARYPASGPDGKLAGDWVRHQFVTSVDWSPENALLVAAFGGANAHVAHHLLPRISHGHHVALSRIVADLAEKHGMPYSRTSAAGMLAAHWRALRLLGSDQAGRLVPGGLGA
ncbi:MAG: hypothetical protein HOH66_09740 [Rhodospirillaceae bacterium]|jgi:linoleoyl-CoA desaturase|nr:hypothetical protein [Rhodospirillaceae bacterium]MBT6118135.1 hypothetical protein [Rhodospirillaceae bacterium]